MDGGMGAMPGMAGMAGMAGMGMAGMGYGMDPMAPMPGMGGMVMPGMGGMGNGAMGGYGGGMAAYGGGYGGAMQGSRDDLDSRKRRGGPNDREAGDWYCMACGNMNFTHRESCNMRKCGAPKPVQQVQQVPNGGARSAIKSRPRGDDSGGAKGGGGEAPPEGSWTCKCGNVNYPFRRECNRRNCGLARETEDGAPSHQDEGSNQA